MESKAARMPDELILSTCVRFAQERKGATGVNPSVSALAWDHQGNVLARERHLQAGSPHAEVQLIETLRKKQILEKVAGIFVTLEPCNHQGKTGPCTEEILRAGIRTIYYGWPDENPKVSGGGHNTLVQAGCEVHSLLRKDCHELVRPFFHWSKTGRPWITLKKALRALPPPPTPHPDLSQSPNFFHSPFLNYTMIPPEGKKTFTQHNSLKISHSLRKTADAILTTANTVATDNPRFTVRLVKDHSPPRATAPILCVLDRKNRINPCFSEWVTLRQADGFEVLIWADSVESALDALGEKGCQEVLVEAGPTLTAYLEKAELWDKRVTILHHDTALPTGQNDVDEIQIELHSRHP